MVFEVLISALTVNSSSSITVKYSEGVAKKIAMYKFNFIKDAGVNLIPAYGVNESGEIEFSTLGLIQSSKKIVKILNQGNAATPKIGEIRTVMRDKAISLISDSCSGSVLSPGSSCFLTLKAESSRLFSGEFSGSVDFISEIDGEVLSSIPLIYSVNADRDFNDELTEVNLISKVEGIHECLNSIDSDKASCFFGVRSSNDYNLVANSSFADTSSWLEQTPGTFGLTAGGNIAPGGGANINRDGKHNRLVYQVIPTTPGEDYRLDVDLLDVQGESDYIIEVRLDPSDLLDDAGPGLNRISESYSPAENGTTKTINFTALNTQTVVGFASDNRSGQSQLAQIDNFMVRASGEVSEIGSGVNLITSDIDCFQDKCYYSLEYALSSSPIRIPISLSFDMNGASSLSNLSYIESETISVPYSQVSGRKLIRDEANSLKGLLGVERIPFNDVVLVSDEFGPLGEPVYQLDSYDDRIRFVGSGWRGVSTSYGTRVDSNNQSNIFMEVTFFGTGLNILSFMGQDSDIRVSVDGGVESADIFTMGSGILGGRSYGSNQVLPVVSGLALGQHTVKIRVASSVYFDVYGVEIVNEGDSLLVAKGSAISSGQSSMASSSFKSLSYKPVGMGVSGGRVVTYLDNNNSLNQSYSGITGDGVSDLVSNGSFDSDLSDWDLLQSSGTASVSWSLGRASLNTGNSTSRLDQPVSLSLGKKYVLSLKSLINNGAELKVLVRYPISGNSDLLYQSAFGEIGNYEFLFTPQEQSAVVRITAGGSSLKNIEVDDISVREFVGRFLAEADHSSEEIIKSLNFRDFGSSRPDDFSTLGTTSSNRSFTLDDGTTTLVGSQVYIPTATNSVGVGFNNSSGSFLSLTFIGSGLDLVMDKDDVVGTFNVQTFVDGILVGSISPNDFALSETATTIRVASGLPYGTHTIKIAPSGTFSLNAVLRDVIIYGPKKPAIPLGAVELADYNVMADYLFRGSVQKIDNVSSGVLLKSAQREVFYEGVNWAAAEVDTINYLTGVKFVSNNSGSAAFEYTFFGTGIEHHFLNNDGINYNHTYSIDGNSDLSDYIVNSELNPSFTFDPSTGNLSGNPISSIRGQVISITGLTLGVHTLRVENAGANSGTMYLDYLGVITPIHVNNLEEGIGSLSMRDQRTFSKDLVGEFIAFDTFTGSLDSWQNESLYSGANIVNRFNSLDVGGNGGAYVYKDVVVIPGEKYRASVDLVSTSASNLLLMVGVHGYNRPYTSAGQDNGLRVFSYGNSGCQVGVPASCSSLYSIAETLPHTYEVEFFAPNLGDNNDGKMRIYLGQDGSGASRYIFDNFKLKRIISSGESESKPSISLANKNIDQVVINDSDTIFSVVISNNSGLDIRDYLKVISNNDKLVWVDTQCASMTTESEGSCIVRFKVLYNHLASDGDILNYTVKLFGEEYQGQITIGKVVGPPATIEYSVVGSLITSLEPQEIILTLKDLSGNVLSGMELDVSSNTDNVSLSTDENGQAILRYGYSDDYYLLAENKNSMLEINNSQEISISVLNLELSKQVDLVWSSCAEAFRLGGISGATTIDIDGNGPSIAEEVFCDVSGQVVLLMSADGSYEEKATGKSVSEAGSVSFMEGRFGLGFDFSSSGNYLQLADSDDWFFGSDDFTIDFWYLSNSPAHFGAIGQQGSATNGNPQNMVHFNRYTNGGIDYYDYEVNQGNPPYLEGWPQAPVGSAKNDSMWHHLAVVRKDGQAFIYNDGVLAGSGPYTLSAVNNPNPMYLGTGRSSSGNLAEHSGGMDEVRIVKGAAMWEGSSFKVPQRGYSHEGLYESVALSADSCKELIKREPSVVSGVYLLDEDGVGGEEPVSVYCGFDSQNYLASSCLTLLEQNPELLGVDGSYWIQPGNSPIEVYCDMSSDGGGWTLLMSLNVNGVENMNTFVGEVNSEQLAEGDIINTHGKLADATIESLRDYSTDYRLIANSSLSASAAPWLSREFKIFAKDDLSLKNNCHAGSTQLNGPIASETGYCGDRISFSADNIDGTSGDTDYIFIKPNDVNAGKVFRMDDYPNHIYSDSNSGNSIWIR